MNKLKKGDQVIVITGRDKGKRGTVSRRVDDDHVVVDGVNVVKKHTKPNPLKGTTGGIVEKAMPIHQSNVAIYNPASRSRRDQVVRLKELALSLRPASTPVVVARDVGGPTEQVRVMRLADLPTDEVDMRTLLLIGSSQTQLVERRPGGEPQVVAWTPRRYPD